MNLIVREKTPDGCWIERLEVEDEGNIFIKQIPQVDTLLELKVNETMEDGPITKDFVVTQVKYSYHGETVYCEVIPYE